MKIIADSSRKPRSTHTSLVEWDDRVEVCLRGKNGERRSVQTFKMRFGVERGRVEVRHKVLANIPTKADNRYLNVLS